MHHLAFRRAYTLLYRRGAEPDLDPTEPWRYSRRAFKSQFSMTCANLAEFRAYWIGDPLRFLARSLICERQFRVPGGAIEIGVYERGIDPETFLADLDCVLLTHDIKRALAAAN